MIVIIYAYEKGGHVKMKQNKTRMITRSAFMIALIFIATYSIKIPNPATGGYSHMGDCMIFLGVLILGRKQGAIAAGLGAALSDLLTGAALWVIPTFVIKFIMAWMMGSVVEKKLFPVGNNVIGALLGGIFQCFSYTLVKIPLFGLAPAIASIFGICMQTLAGLFIFIILNAVLSKTPFMQLKQEELV